MKNPTPEQEKYIRDLVGRTPGNPSVVLPPDKRPAVPNPGIVIRWKKGEFVVSGAEKSNLDAISRDIDRGVVDWINENC
ncbi:MAG: hypothetical protein QOH39_3024 [Verrucomicrobiota bacterium]|jgi:hypothetical protein